jgi:hypothetical protein
MMKRPWPQSNRILVPKQAGKDPGNTHAKEVGVGGPR